MLLVVNKEEMVVNKSLTSSPFLPGGPPAPRDPMGPWRKQTQHDLMIHTVTQLQLQSQLYCHYAASYL